MGRTADQYLLTAGKLGFSCAGTSMTKIISCGFSLVLKTTGWPQVYLRVASILIALYDLYESRREGSGDTY